MGEVGDQGREFHAEIGAYARDRAASSAACTLGEQARGDAAARHFAISNDSTLLAALARTARRRASVLVKGSRFMKMERVVQRSIAHRNKLDKERH